MTPMQLCGGKASKTLRQAAIRTGPHNGKKPADLTYVSEKLTPGKAVLLKIHSEEKATKSPKNTAADAHGLGAPMLSFRAPGTALHSDAFLPLRRRARGPAL
ncbi:hypothetical protein NDU88_005877 [Pleurodeles waltl]|uniref:Uncharacterized protein n=1 Tax=Pleurodeles waltl TaxID=8319 RepID=A0AAV7UKJ1_PLEWA|nr:hypothetical protein NDU88_005877 [Pleurodeles waltl]